MYTLSNSCFVKGLVTFSTVVVKYPNKNNIEERRSFFGSQFVGTVNHVREVLAAGAEAPGHTYSQKAEKNELEHATLFLP